MKRAAAFTIRQGSATVVAYKTKKRNQFCLCYRKHAGAPRSRETRTGEKPARARALDIAIALANGRAEILELTGADRETYVRIKALAADLGVPVFDLFEQAVSAKKRLGSSSLSDAVESHLQVRTINGSRAIVRDLVAEFMRRKRTAMLNGDRSEVHIKNLSGILEGPVLRDFSAREIVSIRTDELQDWLNDRRDRKGKVVGPRRRRHIRAAVVALFNEAQKNRHLPQAINHAAELTDCPKPIKGKEPTFAPEQFDLLINGAHRDKRQCRLVPAFAIGAFGRMRMSEIGRLAWSSVHLFDDLKDGQHGKISGEIDVSGTVAGKTGMARIIEIPPNLGKWLRLYARPSGPVLDPKITRIDNHVRRFAEKLGLKWQRNILRGSCASYLYALTNDLRYVAAQLGTSERELKREYLERKSRGQAEQWSAICPHAAVDNILDLRWSVRG